LRPGGRLPKCLLVKRVHVCGGQAQVGRHLAVAVRRMGLRTRCSPATMSPGSQF
jgi:hypothetical protein